MSELIAGEFIRKLNRLGAMRPRELAHRAREKLYSELDRIGAGIGISNQPRAVVTPFKSYLSATPASRFYRGQRENLRPFVESTFPAWIDRAVAEADRLCQHEVTIFGHGPVQLGDEIDWHRDPVTGRIWEQRFWADYRPVDDSGGRDSKIIHELNRQQHLPRLAKAYRLTGEERYAGEAVAQLNSWIDQNPPGRGINWQSSLEIGIRAISWLWTIFPLLPSRSFDETSAQRIGDSLFAQLAHVHRYMSLYTSPNTHLIGEATALFIAGLVFRDQRQPAAWLRRAAVVLDETMEKQVLEDGVYGELSSCYHCYALDFYLQALVLAEQNGLPLPERASQKVRGMLQFLLHLTRPDGTLPLLGDDDGGRALALDRTNYRSFRDGLCAGAILYRSGDFKHQAGAFAEQALWMLGRDAWEAYRQVAPREPAETQAYYPGAGYAIQRSGWGPLDSHMVFHCGGSGHLTGAHTHADALSVSLFSRGRELLVDPGTFVYNSAPDWRRYFRSTRAHSTVGIDNLDQAEQGGTFSWKTTCRSPVAATLTLPGLEYVEGEHDGYLRLPMGVIHRRRLLSTGPESWIIVDDFRGAGEHRLEFHFHLAADLDGASLAWDGDGVEVKAVQAEFQIRLFGAQAIESAELLRGGRDRLGGWASLEYGEKHQSTTLRATQNGPVPSAAVTFLLRLPAPRAPVPGLPGYPAVRRLKVESGSGIACSHLHDGFEDIVAFSTSSSEMTVAGLRMLGEFFWLRLKDGVLKQVLAVRARSLLCGGEVVFQNPEPGTYRSVL